MKTKYLRPGDWVRTSMQERVSDHPQSSFRPIEGLLISVVRRPGNDMGPLAYVLSNFSGVHVMKASFILERRPVEP